MNKYVLGMGGVLAATTGMAEAEAQVNPGMYNFVNAIQGQHVVNDLRLPTQESMSFDQLRTTGEAFSHLTLVLENNGDVDAAAETVLGTLKGVKRLENPDDLVILKERVIVTAQDKGTWLPNIADPRLEDKFGWHSGTRAMTCFHEPVRP